MEKVLVVAPHHDDEVIGCGGSILIHRQHGDEVMVAYVTRGNSGIPEIDEAQAIATRRVESRQACEILGVTSVVELDQPDRSQWDIDLSRRFIKLFRQFSPQVVYFPHSTDGDVEHQAVNRLVKEALWQSSDIFFPELGVKINYPRLCLGYEVWQPLPHYQFVRDITSVVEIKRQALEVYRSQLTYQAWHEASLGLARYRGVTSGAGQYVEAFQVISLREDTR